MRNLAIPFRMFSPGLSVLGIRFAAGCHSSTVLGLRALRLADGFLPSTISASTTSVPWLVPGCCGEGPLLGFLPGVRPRASSRHGSRIQDYGLFRFP